MIYTLTLNPAIDYIIGVDRFSEGVVNRTSYEKILPGGKGINVSWVLKNLGVKNVALGIIAGFSGAVIKEMLDDLGINNDFINSDNGFSRINVKIKSEEETEINGSGPSTDESDIKNLYKKLDELKDGDFLVMAGSVPKSLPKTIYSDILEYLKEKKLNIILDTTNESLKDALKYNPFLIKPNNFELGELFNVSIKSEDECIYYAKELQKDGAENVLVSLGKEGAVLVLKNGEVIKQKAPIGKVINTTGSGDSMVAGFLAGFIKTGDFLYSLKLGVASGSASAFSENLATEEEIRGDFEEFIKGENFKMKEFNYTIKDELGIHARPAGLLVKMASSFLASVTINKGEKSGDTKRLFAVMGLGIKTGDKICVKIEGEDEEDAYNALLKFFEENL